jgi:hypothetical protein
LSTEQNNQEKSVVEQYWDATRVKFDNQRQWNQLEPQEQHVFIQGINMILSVVSRRV